MSEFLYDKKDVNSIYEYSKKMLGKTFREILVENSDISKESDESDSYGNKRHKGELGELIEEVYFKNKADNLSRPDFIEAGLELKVTPYKINKNKTISSKERMSLGMINYHNLVEEDFYSSGLYEKIKLTLIIFYLWEKNLDKLDYRIDYSYLYDLAKEDIDIIIEDYNKIRSKVKAGKAEELSEGDTLYLGAAVKGSSNSPLRSQPCSDIRAKPRAFSFKNSYMSFLLNHSVVKVDSNKQLEKIKKKNTNQSFEDLVLEKIKKNIGKTNIELINEYYDEFDEKVIEKKLKTKSFYSDLTFRMLGMTSNRAEEFIKANIVLKCFRIHRDIKIVESTPIFNFIIKDLVEEKWEESNIYNYFSETKFLFVLYKEGADGMYRLIDAKFWNMPIKTIESELMEDWTKIVNKFKDGITFNVTFNKNNQVIIKNDLPEKKDLKILGVRPRAQLGFHKIKGKEFGIGKKYRDSDLLPNGDRMTNQSFWLQNSYLEEVLEIKKYI